MSLVCCYHLTKHITSIDALLTVLPFCDATRGRKRIEMLLADCTHSEYILAAFAAVSAFFILSFCDYVKLNVLLIDGSHLDVHVLSACELLFATLYIQTNIVQQLH